MNDTDDTICEVPDCGRLGKEVVECKYCHKRYYHCAEDSHPADMYQAMEGHVLRMHPETLPKQVIERLLKSEHLELLYHEADKNPSMWATLVDFLCEYRSKQN
jgi:hypothetical protein